MAGFEMGKMEYTGARQKCADTDAFIQRIRYRYSVPAFAWTLGPSLSIISPASARQLARRIRAAQFDAQITFHGPRRRLRCAPTRCAPTYGQEKCANKHAQKQKAAKSKDLRGFSGLCSTSSIEHTFAGIW